VPDVQRNAEFLLAAITDTEGTIRATDAKASIALVLHGLLFNGILGVIVKIGTTYHAASESFQTIVVVLLGAALVACLLSVSQLLLCVAPAPRSAIPGLAPGWTSTFFVASRTVGLVNPRVVDVPTNIGERVGALDGRDRLEELGRELVKVSAIRARKLTLIQRGIALLGLEFAVSLAFLILLGLHSA
jgi:hypothetical protein